MRAKLCRQATHQSLSSLETHRTGPGRTFSWTCVDRSRVANGGVERQNRTLLKAIRAAVAEKRDWRSALVTFLMAYRSTPHPATAVSPAELMFGRTIRTKMPEIGRGQPRPATDRVRDNDRQYKARAKVNADRRRRAEPAELSVGDLVLVKVPNKSSKLCGSFFPNPYVLLELRGTQVRVRRGDGKVFRRNKSCVKRFRSCESDGFVPLSVTDEDCAASQKVVQPSHHAVQDAVPSSDEDCAVSQKVVQPSHPAVQDAVPSQRTRSGRTVKQTQFYGHPVKH
ncbi:uncharacterized protein K02A2.6-like [Amphibalanus amphitrite]|uniref:uncharacterized protein K02A2.6-like n=1 Tax=Amphibalanus amphitrite TaxID=1232801 RepID=UPI001C91ED4C|nr:uncharacterized protein K02A2.6-like [Amphibalanus amphitrite]